MSTAKIVPAALLGAALALSTSPGAAQLKGLGALESEKELGCVVGEKETTFRIFAPRATAVTLVLFERHDAERGAEHDMRRDEDGVWRCRTIFNCTDACPRGIQITQAILEVSGAITRRGA